MLLARTAGKATTRCLTTGRCRPALLLRSSSAATTTHSSSQPPARLCSASTSSTPQFVTLGEMNVTRHNFEETFEDLQRDIAAPSCRFVAIDTEFTGLSPNEDQRERYLGA